MGASREDSTLCLEVASLFLPSLKGTLSKQREFIRYEGRETVRIRMKIIAISLNVYFCWASGLARIGYDYLN
jgi:hypothetical protein